MVLATLLSVPVWVGAAVGESHPHFQQCVTEIMRFVVKLALLNSVGSYTHNSQRIKLT